LSLHWLCLWNFAQQLWYTLHNWTIPWDKTSSKELSAKFVTQTPCSKICRYDHFLQEHCLFQPPNLHWKEDIKINHPQ
jgi:hypothetical protein